MQFSLDHQMITDSKLFLNLKTLLLNCQLQNLDIPLNTDTISWVKHPDFKQKIDVSFCRPIKSMKFVLPEKGQDKGKWISFYNGQLSNLNIELSPEFNDDEVTLHPICITQIENVIINISNMLKKQETQRISQKRIVFRGLQFDKPTYVGNKKKCINHIAICALKDEKQLIGLSLSTGFLLKSRDKSHQENGLDQGNFLPQELTQNFQKKSMKQTIQINNDLESLKMYFTAPNIRLKRQEIVQKIFSEYGSQLSRDSQKTLALVLLDNQKPKDQGMEKIDKAFERAKDSKCFYFKSIDDPIWKNIQCNFIHFNTSNEVVKILIKKSIFIIFDVTKREELIAEYVQFHNNSNSTNQELIKESQKIYSSGYQDYENISHQGRNYFSSIINIGDIIQQRRKISSTPFLEISVFPQSINSPSSQSTIQKIQSIQKPFHTNEDTKSEIISNFDQLIKKETSQVKAIPFVKSKDCIKKIENIEEEEQRIQETKESILPTNLDLLSLSSQYNYWIYQQEIMKMQYLSSYGLFPDNSSLQSSQFYQGIQLESQKEPFLPQPSREQQQIIDRQLVLKYILESLR